MVEHLVHQGVEEFDFVLSVLPQKIENALGDGSRWGSTFRYHLARDPEQPYTKLKSIGLGDDDELILFVHGDRLPGVDLEGEKASTTPAVYCWSDASGEEHEQLWTGWARLPAGRLKNLASDWDQPSLGRHMVSLGRDESWLVEAAKPLSVCSYEELLSSHRAALDSEATSSLLTGQRAEDGIWLSRNVTLHPTASLTPPVYVGDNCRIGAGAKLGPNAFLGADCILDDHCSVTNSVVFPGSYVGQGLELTDVVVDKNRLINVRVGAAVSITDDFILGSLSENQFRRWLNGLATRVAALLLLVLTLPLLLSTALCLMIVRRGRLQFPKEFVRLPADTDETTWRKFSLYSFVNQEVARKPYGFQHFFCCFLPGLLNVVKGELRFVGVSPRSADEIRALTPDWRALYLKTKAGIVTEAYVNYGSSPGKHELFSSEAFFSVRTNWRHDLKLLLGYFARLFVSDESQEKAVGTEATSEPVPDSAAKTCV